MHARRLWSQHGASPGLDGGLSSRRWAARFLRVGRMRSVRRRVRATETVASPGARTAPPATTPGTPRGEAVVMVALPPPSLFESDYLVVEHAKIYVRGSRHWLIAWLWFLS